MSLIKNAAVLGALIMTPLHSAALYPDGNRVAVVENAESAASSSIARYYVDSRGIRDHIVIRCRDAAVSAAHETISYDDYRSLIEVPIIAFLAEHPNIDFIVLTKGVPLRIADGAPYGMECRHTKDASDSTSRRPSVDSLLASIGYHDMNGTETVMVKDGEWEGTGLVNRFWNSRERFSHAKFGGYLVTRLDGYTKEDAMALVDRALLSEKEPSRGPGNILIDLAPQRGVPSDHSGEPWSFPMARDGIRRTGEIPFKEVDIDMCRAAALLKARGVPTEFDRTKEFIGNRSGLAGYYSWGSNDPAFTIAAYRSLTFAPGAIGDTLVSTSGRTFLPTTGGQSLVADLIAQGITGVKGYVAEPDGSAIASPSILFDRYTRGWTLAESFYAASRFVAWEDVVIGDALCRPIIYRK